MADASIKIQKKHCIKCDDTKSGGGLFTCDGCQQIFCLRHVNEHRRDLNLQLENAMQEHDPIQQESSQLTINQSVLQKIDAWEKQSIITIQKAAETTRADFHQWYQSANGRIKEECGELAKNLRSARETENYAESDLQKWSQTLDKLKRYLESTAKVDIIEDRQTCVAHIKIQRDRVWSTDAPVQKGTFVSTRRPVSQATNRTDTNRSDNIGSQTHMDRKNQIRRRHNNNNGNNDCAPQ